MHCVVVSKEEMVFGFVRPLIWDNIRSYFDCFFLYGRGFTLLVELEIHGEVA